MNNNTLTLLFDKDNAKVIEKFNNNSLGYWFHMEGDFWLLIQQDESTEEIIWIDSCDDLDHVLEGCNSNILIDRR